MYKRIPYLLQIQLINRKNKIGLNKMKAYCKKPLCFQLKNLGELTGEVLVRNDGVQHTH